VSRPLFPRREPPKSRTEKSGLQINLRKVIYVSTIVIIVIAIATFFAIHFKNAYYSQQSTITKILYVTRIRTVTKTETVTITKTILKPYIPGYVNPRLTIHFLGIRYKSAVPCIDIEYSSTNYFMVIVNTSRGSKYVYSLPPTYHGSACLPFANPCETIANTSLTIDIETLLGKKLAIKTITIGSPNVSATLIQYILDPRNPHKLRYLELQIVNYGTGIAEVNKIVLKLLKGSSTILERILYVGCFYIPNGSSKIIYTPELDIELPSGKYTVYLELVNSDNKVLFEGRLGTIIIG